MLKIQVTEFRKVLERMGVLAGNSLVNDANRTFVLLSDNEKLYAYTEAGSSTKLRYEVKDGSFELDTETLVAERFGYHLRFKQIQDIMATIEDNQIADGQIVLEPVNEGRGLIFRANLLSLYGGDVQPLAVGLMVYNLPSHLESAVLDIPEPIIPQVTSKIEFYLNTLLSTVEDVNNGGAHTTKMMFAENHVFTYSSLVLSKISDTNIPDLLRDSAISKLSLQSLQKIIKEQSEVYTLRDDVSKRMIIRTVDLDTTLIVAFERLSENAMGMRVLDMANAVTPKGYMCVSMRDLTSALRRANLVDNTIRIQVKPVEKPYSVSIDRDFKRLGEVKVEEEVKEVPETEQEFSVASWFANEGISTPDVDDTEVVMNPDLLSEEDESNEKAELVNVTHEWLIHTGDFRQTIPVLASGGVLDLPIEFKFTNTDIIERSVLPFGQDIITFGVTKENIKHEIVLSDATDEWVSIFNV